MVKKTDNRLICSDDKRNAIKQSYIATCAKRKRQILKVYECKIVKTRLNKRQKEQLEKLFVEGKWFYNHVLDIHKNGIKLKDINSTDIKEVKHFDKNGNPILSNLERLKSQQKQAIIERMFSNEKAIESLFKKGIQKHGSLQFKSEIGCIPLKQYGITYKFKTPNKVKIAGISGTILIRTGGQLDNADELANANLIKRPDGYYLKVTTFIDKEKIKPEQTNGKEIGLDFGIKTNITTSEGEKIDVSIEESERLKKLQKEMFRRKKNSNNRLKTIHLLQREYQKLSNRKKDKANKIVSKFKQYKTIVIQDEQLQNWQKGLFGKQIQHSCLGIVKAKLKTLPQTIVLDKWIPTTKMCPNCGTINKHITLNNRTFHCGCGYSEDRDVHSARNMLKIKDLVFSKMNLVPTEHREVTLVEFKASTEEQSLASLDNEAGRCHVFSMA